MMNKRFLTLITIITILTFSACSPIVVTRGNLINNHKFEKIVVKTSKRADLLNEWGPPTATSSFDQNTWYYIGETTEQVGIYAPEVKNRRIVKVQFDKNDNETVISIEDMDISKAKDIALVDRKTPTAGKEFTALQQMVGNLGKYNKSKAGGNE